MATSTSIIQPQLHLLRRQKTGKGFTIIMSDIDHFKRVNDEYGGHAAGDFVLERMLNYLEKFRKTNMCRYGGEEFV